MSEEGTNRIAKTSPWHELKKLTTARVALGRCGVSIPTTEMLQFKLSHAAARDAVHIPLNFNSLQIDLERMFEREVLLLKSAVSDRKEYLERPDLGTLLDHKSKSLLENRQPTGGCDISIVIADGLSATAIETNLRPFLSVLLPELQASYKLAPLTLVEHGRVAIGDPIAFAFKAKISLVLIGERPGLQSNNSMGIYLTYNPKPGLTNDKRNCISNIRPEGLSYPEAASKVLYLISEAIRLKLSGVDLKDGERLVD